jgi:hypothetical protein
MKQANLPQKWQGKIQNFLRENNSKYNEFSADAFHYDLRLEFGDGSNALFCYAFYCIDKDANEIAVFTEHCGYHIFPLFDTKIEAFDKDGNSVKFEDFTFE